ncbi:MAG: hypothetical protein CTY12_06490 [Methylotenera sp.]|nr:MAG: hypothetical protein CTY12_06490 [Methylotenera sp.]
MISKAYANYYNDKIQKVRLLLFCLHVVVYNQLVERNHLAATMLVPCCNNSNLSADIHVLKMCKMLVNDGARWYDARTANLQRCHFKKSTHNLFKGACRFKAKIML